MATGLVVGLIVDVEPLKCEKLRKCIVDIGAEEPINIVTNASIVAGKRVVVAPVGATVDGKPVKKAQVGGVSSEGMLCDAPLVWGKGSANIPATLPDQYQPGDEPPSERPQGGPPSDASEVPAVRTEKPLFELKQKLSKEEKKAAAEAKKAELAAKKAARKAAQADNDAVTDATKVVQDLAL
mmetsp:Transcript_28342/g.77564  ORF Transcript_28342/g.77564 Transcript_28342/m.77564 type:complete len:182 (-) Transcript_28342:428-973(-)|eukprot:scaffold188065_cov39-Tisochrysis_lutea.AAC.1